ncbi:chromate transporter [Flavonifractor plautii]|nr:chromate transporter [Flavonifractor plautii]
MVLVLAVLGSFVSFPAGWAGSVLSFLCSPWCWWWPRGRTVHPGGERRAAAVIYLQLFFEFFKAGLFAIGGGLATIPFLTDIGQRTGWFTSGELANMIAISESTPGPMGVNMATYVGFHTGGIAGALSPPWAWCAPPSSSSWSSRAFEEVPGEPGVDAVFYGIRPASTALIAAALAEVCSIALLNLSAFQTGGAAALFQWKGSPWRRPSSCASR